MPAPPCSRDWSVTTVKPLNRAATWTPPGNSMSRFIGITSSANPSRSGAAARHAPGWGPLPPLGAGGRCLIGCGKDCGSEASVGCERKWPGHPSLLATAARRREEEGMMLAADDFDRTARAIRAGNSALLKLDLYCRGLLLDDSCLVEEDGGRRVLRTRAGLGSGLELILPGGLWTNVPVAEPFAQQSPYLLRRRGGSYLLEREDRPVAPVRLSPRPAWYDATTSTGKPMTRIGTLQGTYLRIYH